jgi:hypothetical protein
LFGGRGIEPSLSRDRNQCGRKRFGRYAHLAFW